LPVAEHAPETSREDAKADAKRESDGLDRTVMDALR
jgi:hypothetical protein